MRRELAICIIASIAAAVWSGRAAAAVVTNTQHVEDIAVDPVDGDTAWVATRGGLEVYSIAARRRLRVYTTADGLATAQLRGIAIADGVATARGEGHVCRLQGERFACVPAPALPAPEPAIAPLFRGARVTARATVARGELVGTAGQGLWLVADDAAPAPITPADQVCSNHIMAMAAHQGRLYLGSFDQGLCVTEGAGFRRLDTPFRMVNDLVSTPAGLYVAASEGLYRLAGSGAGERFERIAFVTEDGVNGLAFDGQSLYATTPAALWRIRVRRGPRTRAFWLPGGSRAVQKVAVGAGAVWLATEDKGVIRLAGGRFQVLDRAAGLPTSWVMDVAADGTTLYAATFRHGLLAIDMQGDMPRVRTIAGVPDEWMLHASTHEGALWVGTQGGAARVEDGAPTTVLPAGADGLPHPCVHAVAHFDGDMWLATEGGLQRLPAAALAGR